MKRLYLILALLLQSSLLFGQRIVDPCFISVKDFGQFYGSDDLVNLCENCSSSISASDLLEWNEERQDWDGELPGSDVDIKPPPGCTKRAVWMGNSNWTGDGEAVGLRLDKPLQAGKSYAYTFTYASTGQGSDHKFSPVFYSVNSPPRLINAYNIGRFPRADNWATYTITFTATEAQDGHNWIIVHADNRSGIVLANCEVNNAIDKSVIAEAKSTFCIGDQVNIAATDGKHLEYRWNTGATTSAITVDQPGKYSVEVQQYNCISKDSVLLDFIDCEVRLEIPNVFSPNGDIYNETFRIQSYNYIAAGNMHIYNRWGKEIYTGDIFGEWNGKDHGVDASTGVYYYELIFNDPKGKEHRRKGSLTLLR